MVQSQFKLKGTPSSALLGATLGFFFGVMAISLFGPTSTTLGAAMGLGATELGLLVSVPSLTGSLLRIPFGAMVDTNGGRRGFLFLLAAAVLGLGALSILFTLYPSTPSFCYLAAWLDAESPPSQWEPLSQIIGLPRVARAMPPASMADWAPLPPASWLSPFRCSSIASGSRPPTIF